MVLKEGSFAVNQLEVTRVDWHAHDNDQCESLTLPDDGYSLAKCMRSVAEPLLVSHFGEGIIEEAFRRYGEIIVDRMSKEKNEFINVTICVTKI